MPALRMFGGSSDGSHPVVARFLNMLVVVPERGFVCTEDARDDGAYESIHPRDYLPRLKAVNDMVQRSVRNDSWLNYEDLVHEHRLFVDDALEVVRRAQEQGSYDDESAVADLERRQAKMFVMSNPAVEF